MTQSVSKRKQFGRSLSDAAVSRNQSITGVFVFVLLGLFAVLSIFLVLLSTQMYRGTVSNADKTGAYRIRTSYIRSMTRSMDAADSVRIDTWTDDSGETISIVSFMENYDGDAYVTQIYAWDGSMWERFTEAIYEFDPEDGDRICDMDEMDVKLEDNLLTAKIMHQGEEQEVCVALRCPQTEMEDRDAE